MSTSWILSVDEIDTVDAIWTNLVPRSSISADWNRKVRHHPVHRGLKHDVRRRARCTH